MVSRRGKRVVRLVPVDGDREISIELHEGINRIGRQRVDNHIVLISPEVSRFHAEIQVALSEQILIADTRADPRLGKPAVGSDCRLLLPLRTQAAPLGLIFIVTTTPGALKARTVEYLALFAEIAAMAVAHRTRDGRR